MAWDVSGKPIGGHKGPLAAYHRLFSKDTTPIEQQKAMLAQKRSVLDTVLENARDCSAASARPTPPSSTNISKASATSRRD